MNSYRTQVNLTGRDQAELPERGIAVDLPPMTMLAPDDPRAQCDAVTPEEFDAVMALSALADRIKSFCAAAITQRPAGGRWLDIADDLRNGAEQSQRHAVLDS